MLSLLLIAALTTPPAITPIPDVIPAAAPDVQEAQVPDRVQLEGMIGARIDASTVNRLLEMDVDRLLEGYRKRPGRQTWDGEHVGKWLHAASLAWANSGDERLHAKVAKAVAELVACQQEDGYLGTYLPAQRWTEWDVWAHKYNLIGLITWMRVSGDRSALPCCRAMADLLCRDFGDGKRDLNGAGAHKGMAAGSVLEPMVWIYRFTGEERYRDFCRYVLRAWETPTGPHIVSRLVAGRGVDQVGNAKAYEMLSCIDGMLEWYRVTGDKDLLTAGENAWSDIVAKRRYITGTASWKEHFHEDFNLPNTSNVGETCVTVTWLQFNAHLLRLTGKARYADELERIVYNQLPGAQRPDGRAWGYYVQMEGTKPYTSTLDGQCCLSSGPRGFALIPTFAITTDAEGVVVNLEDAAHAHLRLAGGAEVGVTIATAYPAEPTVDIAITAAQPGAFSVRLRIPAWCPSATLARAGKALPVEPGPDGYVVVRRTWTGTEHLLLTLPPTPRVVTGDHANQSKAAICYGPLVLAADAALDPHGSDRPQLDTTAVADLAITPMPASGPYKDWAHAEIFRITTHGGTTLLAPFATAGTGPAPGADAASDKRSTYRVWLPIAGAAHADGNLLADGSESRSRSGNVSGSVVDGRVVVTWNGAKKDQDWFMVALPAPVTIARVDFTHGMTAHDGGWFDTSSGRPVVQVQAAEGGPWVTVGEFTDYPATTAASPGSLQEGARFTCTLTQPTTAIAVRVAGRPASGDAPEQSFSSCQQMAAYGPATGGAKP
jgi:DUF1680 family protein